MHEWVSALSSKLREMKIISPKENLYSRLPEIKLPLLPTRDPMSPLPAPPPVPAAIVPGIEPISTAIVSNGNTSTVTSSILTAVANDSEEALPIQSTSTSQRDEAEEESSINTCPDDHHISTVSITDTPSIPTTTSDPPSCPARSNTLTQNLFNLLSDPIVNLANLLTQDASPKSFLDRPSTSADRGGLTTTTDQCVLIDTDSDASSSSSMSSSLARTFTNNVLNDSQKYPLARKKPVKREESLESSSSGSFQSLGEIAPLVIPRPQTNKSTVGEQQQTKQKKSPHLLGESSATTAATAEDKTNGNDNEQAMTNITIIQLSDSVRGNESQQREETTTVSPIASLSDPSSSFMANIEVNCVSPTMDTTMVKVMSPAGTSGSSNGGYDEIRNLETGVTNISVGAILIQSAQATPAAASSSSGNYEQVFIGDWNNNNNSTTNINSRPAVAPTTVAPLQSTPYSVFLLSRQQRSASHVELTTPQRNRVIVDGGTEAGHSPTVASAMSSDRRLPSQQQQQPSSAAVVPTPGSSAAANSLTNGNNNSNHSTRPAKPSGSSGPSPAAAAQSRSGRQRRGGGGAPNLDARKRSSSSSGDHRGNGGVTSGGGLLSGQGNPRIVSPPRVTNGGRGGEALNMQRSGRMSLREQQVVQLRREIMHPSGVRLQLRRKDCIGSIALVDVFNAVWVAGWKQKDHPMLYNALHIGDRLVSVGGVAVTSSAEVNKMIRASQSAYMEFIVRRVPCGRVYAIRRDMDGQCLGLIRESNTATIVDIIPNGLAARHGLPLKANSCDGLSLTFWVLTEINGRPLNLFFKDNEIEDRLNAVGRDISILVQPLDLVTKLKKQLKSMRGHKEFIVQ